MPDIREEAPNYGHLEMGSFRLHLTGARSLSDFTKTHAAEPVRGKRVELDSAIDTAVRRSTGSQIGSGGR